MANEWVKINEDRSNLPKETSYCWVSFYCIDGWWVGIDKFIKTDEIFVYTDNTPTHYKIITTETDKPLPPNK